MQSASGQWFDEAYYERYYFNPKTRVVDEAHFQRLARMVCAYVDYLQVPVRRVLDVGCGIGLWRAPLSAHYPQVQYQGVEISPFLCDTYGWTLGSVVDFTSEEPFDLVICQGVLAYLDPADLQRALSNLSGLCRGVLYVEAATREDYENDVLDDERSDPRLFRHRAQLYRRGLRQGFRELGGGLWLSDRADVPTYELECVRTSA